MNGTFALPSDSALIRQGEASLPSRKKPEGFGDGYKSCYPVKKQWLISG
jgi:hypothetical protein